MCRQPARCSTSGLDRDLDSPGAYLGREVIGNLLAVSGGPFADPFSLSDPVNTGVVSTRPSRACRWPLSAAVTYYEQQEHPARRFLARPPVRDQERVSRSRSPAVSAVGACST